MDIAAVVRRYRDLQHALPGATIQYAVKANPLPDVIRALAEAGSSFDVASEAEIRDCLALGVAPSRCSFGHTIKKAAAITAAHAAGIDLFSFDCLDELEKIACCAPAARVIVRLLTDNTGAEWPLSRKFGCDPDLAFQLMIRARELGLVPHGVSFHVGSQQTNPGQWEPAIAAAANLFRRLRAEGIRLDALNVGGGFPAQYRTPIPPIDAYGTAIAGSLERHFGRTRPQILVEPGRYLVADAGVIETEVVLVARRSPNEPRWVYLDCGRFGGLAETMGEAIKYRLVAPARSGELAPAIVAGPTCDSADVLCEKTPCWLPDDLRAGDRVRILSTGAYTHTYSAVGFNGFAPLRAVCF